ncbi:MAG: hypothetical protein FWH53_01880 [Leptospirales bacterium]|nr:hypothetical protein [Leptospirales bacterium]
MRFLNYLSVETQCIVSLLTFSLLLFGCSLPNTTIDTPANTVANKTMTLEDYLKIESELNIPDPELDPAKVESVASKYGYTYQQYKDFYDSIQRDIKMKDKLGESFKRRDNP